MTFESLPRPGSPITDTQALGHNHANREIQPVGVCVRCDYVRGYVALESRS